MDIADMDLTNLNVSHNIHSELDLVKELEKQKLIEAKLIAELDRSRKEEITYKSMENNLVQIEDLQREIDLLKSEPDTDELLDAKKEVDVLKESIDFWESKTRELEIKSEKCLTDYETAITQLESVQSPSLDNSSFNNDTECLESNACLKEEYINISKEVDECISKIGEHTDKLTSLEIEYSDLKEALAASKKTLAEWKETYQVKLDEKMMLQSTLNQTDCRRLCDINQKDSLFDEVNEERTDVTVKYKILKEKYSKLKRDVELKNRELKKLKDEFNKCKNILFEQQSEEGELNKELNLEAKQRIQILQNSIRELKRMTKTVETYGKIMADGSISDYRVTDDFIEFHCRDVKKEMEITQTELDKVLTRILPIQKELNYTKRELTNFLTKLKYHSDLNVDLQSQLEQYQNTTTENGQTVIKASTGSLKTSGEAVVKKSIRFADDIFKIFE